MNEQADPMGLQVHTILDQAKEIDRKNARIAKLEMALCCWRDCDPPHECPWCRAETEKVLKP